MNEKLRLVGISGSLRSGSYNTALLHAAAEMYGTEVDLELVSIAELPLYNIDLVGLEAEATFNSAISDADGVLFATPEYNYGLPGPLKNAIDWASFPAYRSPFAGKPIGMLGATGSAVGTARAQAHLKQIMLGMLAHVFPWPEFLVGAAKTKFEDGELTDPVTRKFLREYLDGFAEYVARFR